jgi:hypothetical protein
VGLLKRKVPGWEEPLRMVSRRVRPKQSETSQTAARSEKADS